MTLHYCHIIAFLYFIYCIIGSINRHAIACCNYCSNHSSVLRLPSRIAPHRCLGHAGSGGRGLPLCARRMRSRPSLRAVQSSLYAARPLPHACDAPVHWGLRVWDLDTCCPGQEALFS